MSGLDEALDGLPDGHGAIEVARPDGGKASVDVRDVDRLGVRVGGVSVHRGADVDVAEEAAALPERLRALPDPVAPVEVSPELGGAILRTRPDRVPTHGEREFFEVEVKPRQTSIRKVSVGAEGDRSGGDFTLTREQLERLIDETAGT